MSRDSRPWQQGAVETWMVVGHRRGDETEVQLITMDSSALRSFKDFLLQYNQISQTCFERCVDHLSDRELSQDEVKCVEMCTKKHVKVNHKVMQVYMEVQPIMMNKRIEEMSKQQELQAAKTPPIEDTQHSIPSVEQLESSKSDIPLESVDNLVKT